MARKWTMTIIASYSWEDDTFTHHTDARSIWHQTVYDTVTKAQAQLPEELTSRIKKAEELVLNNDVELLPDGKAKVTRQTNGTTEYFVVNGTCTCPDFTRAPQGFCKHRIAAGIERRALTLTQRRFNQADQATPPCGTCRGR